MKASIKWAALAAAICANAQAADSGFFVEASLGTAQSDAMCRFAREVGQDLAYDFRGAAIDYGCKDRGNTRSLQIGYSFSPYFSMQIGQLDLGSIDGKVTLSQNGAKVTMDSRLSTDGQLVTLSGRIPMGSFSLIGSAGTYDWDASLSAVVRANGSLFDSMSFKGSDKSSYASLALGWDVTESLMLKLEAATVMDMKLDGSDEENLELFSLGARYTF